MGYYDAATRIESLITAARYASKGTAENKLQEAINVVHSTSLTDSEKEELVYRIKSVANDLDCDI